LETSFDINCLSCFQRPAFSTAFNSDQTSRFRHLETLGKRPPRSSREGLLIFHHDHKETMTTSTITTPSKTTRGKAASQKRKKTGPRIRPLGDLLNDDTIKPRQQLCGPWLLERGFAMVFAPTGVGKSWFAMGVASAVASGGTFGHWSAPEPRCVLYIDGEMDASDLKNRFQSIIRAAQDGDRDLIAENVHLFARNYQPEGYTSFPDFGNPEHTNRILESIRRVRPDLVILDNLSTLATVDDDNAAEAWDDFLQLLQKIRALGAAVLVVHHANKGGEQYRGSSKIPVMFDALVRLRPDSTTAGEGAAFLLDFAKVRMLTEDAGKTFTVAFSDNQWRWDTAVDAATMDLVRRLLAGEFTTQTAAAQAIGKSKGEVSKMLGDAYRAGITTRDAIRKALKDAREEANETMAEAQIDF
jgi:KaiC/GvpD/RAD55 family RecA-like ATPase